MRLQQLDGLRALALLLVILVHHGLLKSGWIGVDIFFVLSGFLITGILRRESKRANYWTWFYTKRLTRLLPPLVLVFSVAVMTEGGSPLISATSFLQETLSSSRRTTFPHLDRSGLSPLKNISTSSGRWRYAS